MNWKLKENIRLNKICETCSFGTSFTGSDEITLCLIDMDDFTRCDYDSYPKLIPRIKTCLKWKEENV